MRITGAISISIAILSTLILINGGPLGFESFQVPTNLGFLFLGVPRDAIRQIRENW